MTITFYRLPAGVDARPLLQGLPGDACLCPHWGYVIPGSLRIHTRDGAYAVNAGEPFHVEPGHALETLEPIEMFEVSPTREAREGWQHSSDCSRQPAPLADELGGRRRAPLTRFV